MSFLETARARLQPFPRWRLASKRQAISTTTTAASTISTTSAVQAAQLRRSSGQTGQPINIPEPSIQTSRPKAANHHTATNLNYTHNNSSPKTIQPRCYSHCPTSQLCFTFLSHQPEPQNQLDSNTEAATAIQYLDRSLQASHTASSCQVEPRQSTTAVIHNLSQWQEYSTAHKGVSKPIASQQVQ
jgi:hypothetical protein